MKKTFVLGTRGSDLALAQTRLVAARLRRAHPEITVEERIVRTTGDLRLDVPLSAPGSLGPLDKGLFTKELEETLLRGEIDAAVHSLKDLPTALPAGLTLGAILEREDPSDVLVTKGNGGLAALPGGATIATSSLRRKCFLRWRRPDLALAEIRGNVPTRLRRLRDTAELAGLVLAAAGLRRLLAAGCEPPLDGLEITPLPFMLPAPGQGAVAVECRADDTSALLAAIHDEATAACVHAERAVLSGIGGGCHSPLGVRAEIRDGRLAIRAAWFAGDESTPRTAEAAGAAEDGPSLARTVAETLRGIT